MTAKTIESAPDIFEFWAHVPAGANEHPDDTPVLNHRGHRLRRDCLPGPFFGPLQSAPVVILTSAPGATQRRRGRPRRSLRQVSARPSAL